MPFLSSAVKIKNQTVQIMIRPDDALDLVWVQTVCQGYQQTALVDKELIERTVRPDLGPTVYPHLVEFLYFDIQSTG